MTFQNYISALFYLQESCKYMTSGLKFEVQDTVSKLIKEGGEEGIQYYGFQVWTELERHIPEILFERMQKLSPKEVFKKSEVRLLFYAYPGYNHGLKEEETSDTHPFCGGKVTITRKVSDTSIRCQVIIGKTKEINKKDVKDLANLIKEIYEELEALKEDEAA